jgi:hypothetical protein
MGNEQSGEARRVQRSSPEIHESEQPTVSISENDQSEQTNPVSYLSTQEIRLWRLQLMLDR